MTKFNEYEIAMLRSIVRKRSKEVIWEYLKRGEPGRLDDFEKEMLRRLKAVNGRTFLLETLASIEDNEKRCPACNSVEDMFGDCRDAFHDRSVKRLIGDDAV